MSVPAFRVIDANQFEVANYDHEDKTFEIISDKISRFFVFAEGNFLEGVETLSINSLSKEGWMVFGSNCPAFKWEINGNIATLKVK